MKIYIGQIGDAICVYDGRGTSTYPVEQFDELLAAMQLARADYGEPTEGYRDLFMSDEYAQQQAYYARPIKEERFELDLDNIVADISAGLTKEGASEDHTASNSDIDF